MPRKQVGAIDKALLDRVDAARGDVPRTRFVERALERALETAQVGGQGTPEVGDADERTPASSRASVKDLPLDTAAQHASADPLLQPLRSCEKCGKEYGSPSLRRCLECNGKIVPEPTL